MTEDFLDRMEQLDPKERLVCLVVLDLSVLLVLQVSLAPEELRALKVHLVVLALRERKVYKDPLDLLALQVMSFSHCPFKSPRSLSVPSMPARWSQIRTTHQLTPPVRSS